MIFGIGSNFKNLIIMKYILVEWPESQEFIGRPDCYFCQCNDENSFGALDQAMFVPENIYDSYINGNTNTI